MVSIGVDIVNGHVVGLHLRL